MILFVRQQPTESPSFSRQNRFFGYSAPTRFFLNRAVLHSVFHCIFRHLWIRGSRDPDLWNLSCDIAVEWIIDSFEKKSVKRALSGIRTNIYNDFRQYKIPITAANIYRYLLPDIADNPDRLNQLMMEFFTDDHRFCQKNRQLRLPP